MPRNIWKPTTSTVNVCFCHVIAFIFNSIKAHVIFPTPATNFPTKSLRSKRRRSVCIFQVAVSHAIQACTVLWQCCGSAVAVLCCAVLCCGSAVLWLGCAVLCCGSAVAVLWQCCGSAVAVLCCAVAVLCCGSAVQCCAVAVLCCATA